MSADVNIVVGAEDRATQVLNKVASSVGAMGGVIATLGPAAVAAAAALVPAAAAFTALSAAINGTQEAAGKIDELVDKATGLGDSVGNLQAFQFAMEEAGGISADQSIQALQKVQKLVGDIAGGGGEQAGELFKKLGLDAEALSMQGPVDQFLAVKAAIGGIENVSERAAVAQQLLGKSASDLIPALISEQEGFEASMQAAQDLGLVVSEEGAAGVAAMNDAVGRLSAGFEGVYNQLAVAVAPVIETIATELAAWVPPIIEFANEYLPQVVDLLVQVAGFATDVVAAFMRIQQMDFVGAATILTEMKTADEWLDKIQEKRAAAAAQAEANAAKQQAMASAALIIEKEVTDEKAKQASSGEKTIEQLERQLAIAQHGQEFVERQEELASATNDAERERIRILQEQLEQQNAINDSQKEFAEAQKKAAAEEQRKAEQLAKEAADKALALSRPAAENQATESRLLSRGRSDQGIDSIAKNTEKQLGKFDQLIEVVREKLSGNPASGAMFVEVA